MEIMLQLHGGGGGGGSSAPPVKNSAPGSTAVAGLDGMAQGERANLRSQLANKKGRSFTNKTGAGIIESAKKALLGE